MSKARKDAVSRGSKALEWLKKAWRSPRPDRPAVERPYSSDRVSSEATAWKYCSSGGSMT